MKMDMPKKKSKLAMLSKPEKSSKFDASELESEMSAEDMDSGNEHASEADAESKDPEMESQESDAIQQLESVSDEDLMAELRRRGLASKAEEASGEPSSDEQYGV